MGNYYLHEKNQVISISKEKEQEIWSLYFDGVRCKYGVRASVVLKSPKGGYKIFTYRLTWKPTNNAVEYEVLFLGITQATKMGIRCLKVYGNSELIIKKM